MTLFTERNHNLISKYLVPSFEFINKCEFNLNNERKRRLSNNGIHGIKGFLSVAHLIENEPQLNGKLSLQGPLTQQEKDIKKKQ
jgi:hypothetical protein